MAPAGTGAIGDCLGFQVRSRPAALRLAVGILAGASCLVLIGRLDLSALFGVLRSVSLSYAVAALALNLAYFIVRGLRWWLLIQSVHTKITLFGATGISSLGVFMSSLYPGLGEATRLILLRRYCTPTAGAAAVVLAERLIDTATLGVLLIVGLHFSPALPSANLAGYARPLILLVVLGLALVSFLRMRSRGRERGRGRGILGHISATANRVAGFLWGMGGSMVGLLRRPKLCLGIAAAILSTHLIAVGTAWLTMSAFQLSVPPMTVLALVVLVNFGLGLFPSPLGLGLYQFAGLMVLGGVTANSEIAVGAATGLQLVNYAAAILAVLVAVIAELWPRGSRVEPARGGQGCNDGKGRA